MTLTSESGTKVNGFQNAARIHGRRSVCTGNIREVERLTCNNTVPDIRIMIISFAFVSRDRFPPRVAVQK